MSYPFINKNRIPSYKIATAIAKTFIQNEIDYYLKDFEGYERTEGQPIDYNDMVEAEKVSFIIKTRNIKEKI